MAAIAATAAVAAVNKPHISSPVDKPFCSPSQKLLSLATKTLPKPYNHHRTLTTCASKNPLTDVVHSGQPDPDGHSFVSYFDADDKPREECDVVGIYGDSEASRLCYLALHALQHRGQEGAGIVCVNDNVHKSITGVGLVFDVFSESKLDRLPGDLAIGHVRYSTAGASMLKNVQPFVASYRFGSVGVAHNGNLVNYKQLRGELEENGSIFNTSSDTEVVLHLIAISKARPFLLRIVEACEKIEGAYSMAFATEDKLVAVRDPYGFRPLVMGRRSNSAIVFASESCALDLIEATYEREILPGEVVVVDKGVQFICLMPHPEPKSCIFVHIYFALPNSVVFGRSVYESRRAFGEILATKAPVECDVVIAVPEHIYFALPNSVVLSGVALLSFKAARVPKDKEHPYGHGKFETLGAFGISGVLLATAGGIGWHASDVLLVLWSAAPEVVNQSHLHMHEQHHSGHHHGIDMDHPVLTLNVTILSIAVKEAIKRGRGAVGSRMDEAGPYLPSSPDPREKESASPNMKLSKVHRYHAVIGPEKPDWLNSTGSSENESVR
ncbi:Amidophosphoribosyltransferase, chloroplastic [Capsicum baccatum]|uniref:Amidophosphoribosyltransferase, chloroplastic n=1 Tax=Capsicum baccatum TaxID=33114 RepID=A0A2G2X3I3_CAPBA|nr:Amidophosphoribosyltransferase, chloroplastic [Capsicum baccatum]